MAITKEAIIKASLDILNRDGISNLSMRALAKELNIKAASLYWHIKDKQDLYGLIAEHINQEITLPETIDDAKDALTTLALEIRRVLLKTRDAVDIFALSFPSTPSRIKAIKFMLATLTEYGVSDKNCLSAANIMNNYVLSFVADEIRAKHISEQFSPEEAKQFGLIFGEQYEMSLDFEQQFLYGLRVILTGLLVD
ncbi:TetR/AcrR family transcriptional regulator C-terminal domain-containing protein [Peribacillus simplex]|uniref:TetR/AcrR family transcriptional regulator C-terminal domain-containing protein n=1 Tax=Peribacillus simplex TaxID=1478 RepID=UPI00366F7757